MARFWGSTASLWQCCAIWATSASNNMPPTVFLWLPIGAVAFCVSFSSPLKQLARKIWKILANQPRSANPYIIHIANPGISRSNSESLRGQKGFPCIPRASRRHSSSSHGLRTPGVALDSWPRVWKAKVSRLGMLTTCYHPTKKVLFKRLFGCSLGYWVFYP